MLDIEKLNFEKGGGFVTVVTQDARSGVVLMVARADRQALEKSVSSGEMHYHSRTRGLWRKGATSGNIQKVISLLPDCDGDAVLARVLPAGPTCHTGMQSCFGEAALSADALGELDRTISQRAAASGDTAKSSYTRKLLDNRNLRLKKLGEEAAELVAACADADSKRAVEEGADLLYHLLVALHGAGGDLSGLRAELAARSTRARPPEHRP